MRLFREIALSFVLLAACHAAPQQYKKKSTVGLKRAVEPYSYPVPKEKFEENQGNEKSKVIVETIKSISPSEYVTSTGYVGSSIEASTGSGKIPVGTITYNAFEPDTNKKSTAVSFISTETEAPGKKKSNSKYYTGSIGSNSQKANSLTQLSSTIQPAPVRTTSVEPGTTGFSGYQYPSQSSNFQQPSASGGTAASEKPSKISPGKGKPSNGRYTPQKTGKKPSKSDSKVSDSKPEETGFNGYHYDVGSLGFESKPAGGSQGGGMMGASYMRSSSPFYNYHVMLD